MEQKPNDRAAIPNIQSAKTLGEFVKNSLNLIKVYVSADAFHEKIRQMGIKSRITYRQIISGKRRFPENKLPELGDTFDLSFSGRKAAHALADGFSVCERSHGAKYIVGSALALSDPAHTIILNICGCRKLTTKEVLERLQSICCAQEAANMVEMLLDEGLLQKDSEGYLTRTLGHYQLTAPPGVKLAHAKRYIMQSLRMAEINYDLPLEQREYAAFTTRIKKEDFLKLKDLVRNFRQSVYELSAMEECDAVVQVNVNAFLAATLDTKEESVHLDPSLP